ncbi:MAG: ABC transporter ATP-binding protein, partial [Rhodospirillaceae bacterium]|nr:ABC transporter ATP-binding protein [Rhodospirillaceae bacterium]
ISEEFIGSVVTLFLESKDGTEFKVQIQERELADIDLRGDNELFINWAPNSAHLLPDSKEQA